MNLQKSKPSCDAAVENVGRANKNGLSHHHTYKKILIVEPSSQSCRKNPKHFTTKHTITKWVECVCRANQCQTFASKALRCFESPLGSTRALFQSTDSHDSAVIGHWFALLMHALTDPDAEMAETPFLPAPNSDVHALHLMCHWTTIIRGKDIKKWKKVGETQTDKLISGVRASALLRSTFDLVCLTHVRSTHAYVHFALSVCIHLKPYTIIRQSACNWINSTHLTSIHWPPIRSYMKNTVFFNTNK